MVNPSAGAAPQRRTQKERSAETRLRLLDATIDCLVERGYARTTTTEIANRAGLSRGAQLHHFPTKVQLVLAAVEHWIDVCHREFRQTLEERPADGDFQAMSIDLLWQCVRGPTYLAWLELTVAARTDPELRDSVRAVTVQFRNTVEKTFREIFPERPADDPFFDVAPPFIFALMDGLAVQEIAASDPARVDKVLTLVKQLAGLMPPVHQPN